MPSVQEQKEYGLIEKQEIENHYSENKILKDFNYSLDRESIQKLTQELNKRDLQFYDF